MRLSEIKTPAYVIDEKKLEDNLKILADVEQKAGCKILLAQKAFSAFAEYTLIANTYREPLPAVFMKLSLAQRRWGKRIISFAPVTGRKR